VRENIYTVAALIRKINSLLEAGFRNIRVEGEISNFSRSGRGHLYFSLKDESAQLDCVMWASTASRLRFDLEDGLAVLAGGTLTIYPGRGRFQMIVSSIEPEGIGALQLAFEQLKARLAKEGLFDAERKKELPMLPQRVGIVTSATGAALQDMLKILRRSHDVDILVAPAAVQGKGAEAEIAAAIGALVARGDRDVIILARGGGSMEDLWAFNTEETARAIADCPVATISGVGHEVDFCISDFVADLRAATPTHAAEIIISRIEEQHRRLEDARRRAVRDLLRHQAAAQARLKAALGSAGLARVPEKLQRVSLRLQRARRLPALLQRKAHRTRERLDRADVALRHFPARIRARGQSRLLTIVVGRAVSLLRARLLRCETLLDTQERALDHLSPRKVLNRGYSITMVEGESIPLRRASDLRKGMVLRTILAEGSLRSLLADRETPARQVSEGVSPLQASLFEDGGDCDEEK